MFKISNYHEQKDINATRSSPKGYRFASQLKPQNISRSETSQVADVTQRPRVRASLKFCQWEILAACFSLLK